MNTGENVSTDIFTVNTYQPGHKIKPHLDGSDGVGVVLAAQGVGVATLSSRATFESNVRTVLEPGDALILPAQLNGYEGREHQAMHGVENITPVSRSKGIRRSVVMFYDRTRDE
jgi:hypothetical protein